MHEPFVTQPLNTQGLNRYSYVQNRPLNLTDPSGYDPGHGQDGGSGPGQSGGGSPSGQGSGMTTGAPAGGSASAGGGVMFSSVEDVNTVLNGIAEWVECSFGGCDKGDPSRMTPAHGNPEANPNPQGIAPTTVAQPVRRGVQC